MKTRLLFTLMITICTLNLLAHIINVPADFSSIQEGIDASSDGDSFYNSPDRVMHVTTIYYSLEENTVVNLTVYTSDQGPIVLIQNEKLQRGEHSVKFNTKGMKPGSYWAVLETGSSV